MNADFVIARLGARSDTPSVEALLAEAGVTRRPKLAKGQFDAHASAKKRGLGLVFEDEGDVSSERWARPGYRLFVDYGDGAASIRMVTCQVGD